MEALCSYPLYWHGCYKDTFNLIAPDSYAHPAKMAPALGFKIMEHLKELGLLKDSDTILDPMAGTGLTAIIAGAKGHRAVTVELEDKFVGFEKQNKEYAQRKLYKSLDWEILQGDARKLSELLKTKGLVSVTSPPYGEAKGSKHDSPRFREMSKEKGLYEIYGKAEGQIGKLKDKPLKAITSPPYGETGISGGDLEARLKRLEEAGYHEIVRQYREGNPKARNFVLKNYGETEGQLAKLPDRPLKSITSPPYGETGVGDWRTGRYEFQAWVINEIKTKGYVEWQGKRYNEAEWRAMNHGRVDGRTTKGVHKHPTDGYSDNPSNLGNFPDRPLKSITSPPYANRVDDHGVDQKGYEGFTDKLGEYGRAQGQIGALSDKPLKAITSPPYDGQVSASNSDLHPERQMSMPAGRQYGHSNGQLGDEHDETYLSAMFQVYSEIAKVSDVLVVVIKNPTRNKQLRRLDLDTIEILKQAGWSIHCQHRALLFEELEQGHLSFFKRLSWQNGQPVANWEDIIICTRLVDDKLPNRYCAPLSPKKVAMGND